MNSISHIKSVLLVVAAPAEAAAIAKSVGCSPPERDWMPVSLPAGRDADLRSVSLVRSGVGKVNAALCAAICLQRAGPFDLVINIGIGGTLAASGLNPSTGDVSKAELLDVIVASRSVYADEGSWNEAKFVDISDAGFPPGGSIQDERAFAGMTIDCEPWTTWAASRIGSDARIGTIATVSTCSGRDQLANEIATRTGAIVEGMEGAAVGHAVRRVGGPNVGFVEVRVVSNTTGDRSKQIWKLRESLAKLGEVARRLIEPT